jgi:hypothetical protein
MQSNLLNVMKIPHFGRHQEVNACVKLLLASYHRGYLWLDCHITIDLTLINRIIGLRMYGPDPHEYYPGKTANRSLVQKTKNPMAMLRKAREATR